MGTFFVNGQMKLKGPVNLDLHRFICPSTHTFGTASIIWGVIGPRLQFSQGTLFYRKTNSFDFLLFTMTQPATFLALLYFFLIGAILPVVPYLITRKYPNSIAKYLRYARPNAQSSQLKRIQLPCYLKWNGCYSSRHRRQLRSMGHSRVHVSF